VLGQVRDLVRRTQGLDLQAAELDYNLLTSWFEARKVVVRGTGLANLPAPLEAERVEMRLPVAQLVRGSFQAARMRIDGLSVRRVTNKDGRDNWPTFRWSGESAPGGPQVTVTDADLQFQDDGANLVFQLTHARASGAWDEARQGYRVTLDAAGGRFDSEKARFPLTQTQLRLITIKDGVSVESLRLTSSALEAESRGVISGTPARIDASADLNFDLLPLARALGARLPAQGRLSAQLKAAGPLNGFELSAEVRGRSLDVSGLAVRDASAAALANSGTGEVRIRNFAGLLMSGRLSGSGVVFAGSKRGASELTASLAGLDTKRVAALLGASGIPAGRATIDAKASWPNLDWRRARITGSAHSPPAKMGFEAVCEPEFIRASVEASLGEEARLNGDLAFRLSDRSLSGTLRGDVASLARVGASVEEMLDSPSRPFTSTGLDGHAQWTADLSGSIRHPEASVRLNAGGLTAGRVRGVEAHLDAGYGDGKIAVRSARAAWAGQSVELSGEIGGLDQSAPVRLDGRLQGSSLAEVRRQLGIGTPVEASVSADLRVRGTLGSPAVASSLQATGVDVDGVQVPRLEAEASWRDGELRVSRLTAQQLSGAGSSGQIEATGSLNPSTGAYSVDLSGKQVDTAGTVLPGGLAVKGIFHFEVHGKGLVRSPTFTAELTGTGVKVNGLEVGEVVGGAGANGRFAAANLSLPTLHIDASSRLTMDGSWPFEIESKAQNTRWASPDIALNATAHASGTLYPAHVDQGAAAIANFRFAEAGVEVSSDGPLELAYRNDRIEVQKLALKSGDSVLRVSGGLPIDEGGSPGAVNIRGSLALEPIAQWLPDGSAAGGTVDVDVAVTGSAADWQPSGKLTVREGRVQLKAAPLALEHLGGQLEVASGLIRAKQIDGTAGNGKLSINGSLPLRLLSSVFRPPDSGAEQAARFAVQARGVTLPFGRGAGAGVGTFGFDLSGEAPAFSLEALRTTVEFSEFQLKGEHMDVVQSAPTRLSLAGGVAALERLELKGPQSSLSATGSLGLKGASPVKLDAKGTVDLAGLAAMDPAIEAAGLMRMDVKMEGTLDAPQARGFVEIENARVALTAPQLQASGIAFRADLDGRQVQLRKLSGILNGGTFDGGGKLELGEQGIGDSSLFLTGKNIFLEFPASLKTTSSLDLKLVNRKGALTLEGKVDVQEGYYESPLDVFSSGAGATLDVTEQVEQESGGRPVGLDIAISTRRPLEMSNNFGRISATADLRVAGTTQRPKLLGNLRLERDGKLYFGDRTYYIERGTVKFLDAVRITPEFDIHAYTRSSDYTIKLGLTGEIGEITTTFTSDPPLSRDDVIAVLLTGKTVAENKGVDLRSLEAFSLATGAMNASLSSKMHRAIGVSRVSIQPGAVAAESNPGARITITQDFTETLRLLYSMNLSDSNDQIWVAEYDLSRRFTTRAVKQSDNTYRAEFRHDVRFGKSSAEAGQVAAAPAQKIAKVEFIGGGPIPQAELAKKFKVKPGQKYKAQKVRKNSERLATFLAKKGYLESRVRLDRDDEGEAVSLTVRIELGPTVELAYQGADVSGKQKSRLRTVWHGGISDQQRPQAVIDSLLVYLAGKGYLRAEAKSDVSAEGGKKRAVFSIQPGIRYRGVKTLIEGAEPGRAEEILGLLHERKLEPTANRDPRRIIDAIARYYQQRGYLAAKISAPVDRLDEDRRTGSFTIPVEEGPRFHVGTIGFTGNEAFNAEVLAAGLPLAHGEVFEPGRVDPTLAALKLKYGKLGYRAARFDYELKRDDGRAAVDVLFKVAENAQTEISSVTVQGNRQTGEKFVRDRLTVAAGDVADTSRVRESLRSLSQTGAYATTDIEFHLPPDAGAGDKRVQAADMVVSVVEPKPFRLLYGGLYDSGGGPGFIADLQNHNSLGAGRLLGLRTRVDPETDEFRLYASQPFLGLRRISTTVSTYLTRETVEGQSRPTDKAGASIQQDWSLRSRFLVSYGYRFEKQRGFVPDPAAPNIPEDVVAVSPITATISREARDNFLDATRGSFMSHGFEYAPGFLGSDYPYFRYYLQYFKYFPLTHPRPVPYGEQAQRPRLVFATGSRIGMQKGFNSTGAVLTDRFYAGGGTTVRGFRQDELGPKLANGQPAGGNAVLVLNEEIRFPLFSVFEGVGFVDIGNVFPRVTDFQFSELRAASGFGLRIRNPFVVLRLDYGFKLGRRPGEKIGAFFFSIGQAF
jgi:outer membrane protein assembly complex protein YaeT